MAFHGAKRRLSRYGRGVFKRRPPQSNAPKGRTKQPLASNPPQDVEITPPTPNSASLLPDDNNDNFIPFHPPHLACRLAAGSRRTSTSTSIYFSRRQHRSRFYEWRGPPINVPFHRCELEPFSFGGAPFHLPPLSSNRPQQSSSFSSHADGPLLFIRLIILFLFFGAIPGTAPWVQSTGLPTLQRLFQSLHLLIGLTMNKISTFSHTSYLWASPLMNLEPTKNFLASLQLQAADTWFSSTITATFHYIITTIPPIINTISSSFTAILPTYVNLLIRSRLPVLISLCLYITCRPTAQQPPACVRQSSQHLQRTIHHFNLARFLRIYFLVVTATSISLIMKSATSNTTTPTNNLNALPRELPADYPPLPSNKPAPAAGALTQPLVPAEIVTTQAAAAPTLATDPNDISTVLTAIAQLQNNLVATTNQLGQRLEDQQSQINTLLRPPTTVTTTYAAAASTHAPTESTTTGMSLITQADPPSPRSPSRFPGPPSESVLKSPPPMHLQPSSTHISTQMRPSGNLPPSKALGLYAYCMASSAKLRELTPSTERVEVSAEDVSAMITSLHNKHAPKIPISVSDILVRLVGPLNRKKVLAKYKLVPQDQSSVHTLSEIQHSWNEFTSSRIHQTLGPKEGCPPIVPAFNFGFFPINGPRQVTIGYFNGLLGNWSTPHNCATHRSLTSKLVSTVLNLVEDKSIFHPYAYNTAWSIYDHIGITTERSKVRLGDKRFVEVFALVASDNTHSIDFGRAIMNSSQGHLLRLLEGGLQGIQTSITPIPSGGNRQARMDLLQRVAESAKGTKTRTYVHRIPVRGAVVNDPAFASCLARGLDFLKGFMFDQSKGRNNVHVALIFRHVPEVELNKADFYRTRIYSIFPRADPAFGLPSTTAHPPQPSGLPTPANSSLPINNSSLCIDLTREAELDDADSIFAVPWGVGGAASAGVYASWDGAKGAKHVVEGVPYAPQFMKKFENNDIDGAWDHIQKYWPYVHDQASLLNNVTRFAPLTMTNIDIGYFPRFGERSVDRTKEEFTMTNDLPAPVFAARARCTPGDPTYDETYGTELIRRYGTSNDSDALRAQPINPPPTDNTSDELAAQAQSQLSLDNQGRQSPKRPGTPQQTLHPPKRARANADDDNDSSTRGSSPTLLSHTDYDLDGDDLVGLSQNTPFGMIFVPEAAFMCATDVQKFIGNYTTDPNIRVSCCSYRQHKRAFLIHGPSPEAIDRLHTYITDEFTFGRSFETFMLTASMWSEIVHQPYDDHANRLSSSLMVYECKGRCPTDFEQQLADIINTSASELEVVQRFFAAVPSANGKATLP